MDPLRGHDGQVLAVAFDRSGERIATGSTDQTARVWRVRPGRPYTTLFGHRHMSATSPSGPGGVIVTASSDGTARTWLAEGVPARILRGHRGPVRKAAFAADGSVVTGGADGTVRDLGAGDEHRSRASHRPASAPSLPRRRGTLSGRHDQRSGGRPARPPSDAVGRKGARGAQGRREQRRVQPRRPSARQRGARPRRDRLGRGDGRRGLPHRRGAIRLGRGRAVQPRRPLARHRRAEVRPSVDGGRQAGALPVRADVAPRGRRLRRRAARAVVSLEPDGAVRRWTCELCGDLDSLEALAELRLRGTRRTITAEERARYFREAP